MPVSFLLKKALPSLREAKTTEDAARALLQYFAANGYHRHPSFLISGFGETPSVLNLPAGKDTWKEQFPKQDVYGVTTMGDNRIAQAIINSGPMDYHLFRIPDAVRFVRFLLETTARTQAFQKTRQTVSEACDLLLMSEEKAQWVLRSYDPCQLQKRVCASSFLIL